MATSRTGTSVYKRNRARIVAVAKADGIIYCPGFTTSVGTVQACGAALDYDNPHRANSVEVDHIDEHRFGGGDEVTNLRVLCRACNTARNRKRPANTDATADSFPTLRRW